MSPRIPLPSSDSIHESNNGVPKLSKSLSRAAPFHELSQKNERPSSPRASSSQNSASSRTTKSDSGLHEFQGLGSASFKTCPRIHSQLAQLSHPFPESFILAFRRRTAQQTR